MNYSIESTLFLHNLRHKAELLQSPDFRDLLTFADNLSTQVMEIVFLTDVLVQMYNTGVNEVIHEESWKVFRKDQVITDLNLKLKIFHLEAAKLPSQDRIAELKALLPIGFKRDIWFFASLVRNLRGEVNQYQQTFKILLELTSTPNLSKESLEQVKLCHQKLHSLIYQK